MSSPLGRPLPLPNLRPAARLLFLAGLLLGAAEIFVLIIVGQQIGWAPTGAPAPARDLAARRLGAAAGGAARRSCQAFRTDLRERRPPGASATDGLLVLLGGVLMLIPGFISDVAGALLVAPPTRKAAAGWAQSLLARRLTPSTATSLFGPRTVRVRTGTPHRRRARPAIRRRAQLRPRFG